MRTTTLDARSPRIPTLNIVDAMDFELTNATSRERWVDRYPRLHHLLWMLVPVGLGVWIGTIVAGFNRLTYQEVDAVAEWNEESRQVRHDEWLEFAADRLTQEALPFLLVALSILVLIPYLLRAIFPERAGYRHLLQFAVVFALVLVATLGIIVMRSFGWQPS
ncbi:hypothetical protein [Gulosibacter faecalis]|jgi:hypothetical protein|uniref:DUF1634 domain-containing protein n=1 Tax=Gulosibacter faecalis TaxID=272240 RepID=A0ABW5UW91_9MICO|nr:hypothetical protein [Gulosibacter faecalis]